MKKTTDTAMNNTTTTMNMKLSRPPLAAGLLAGLLMAATLVALALTGGASPLSAQQTQQRPVLGTIISVQAMDLGQTIITLRDQSGETLEVAALDESTIVTIPGRASRLARDLRVGDVVGGLARVDGESLTALSLTSKPSQVENYLHVSGVLIAQGVSAATLLDAEGNRITVDLPPGARTDLPIGEAMTAVIYYDSRLGTFTGLSMEPAVESAGRLAVALLEAHDAGNAENARNLELRMIDASGRVMAALNQALARGPDSAVANVPLAIEQLRAFLNTFGLPGPVTMATGVVDYVNPDSGLIGLVTPMGETIDLVIADGTVIREGRDDVAPGSDMVGRRVQASYDPDPGSMQAHRLNLLPEDGIDPRVVAQRVQQANAGEIEGIVAALDLEPDPGSVVIQLPNGERLPLRAPGNAGYALTLPSFLNASVAVRYDTLTYDILHIERAQTRTSGTAIAGVVVDLDPKETREVAIATDGGRVLRLTLADDSSLEKDGLRIRVTDINRGDVVRPVSRYEVSDMTVRRLALTSPRVSITGPVLGLDVAGGRVTVMQSGMRITTITIAESTELLRNDEAITLDTVRRGERLASGSLYNPLTSLAARVVVEPPQTARASGSLIDLDTANLIITIGDPAGVPLVLMVPNKPRVVIVDGDNTARLSDVPVGTSQVVAVYGRDDMVVIELVVTTAP